MRSNTWIFTIFSLLLLEGCSGFKSSAPAPDIYMLHAPQGSPAAENHRLHVIAVSEPEVPAGFETDKIVVYLQQERRMDYAAHAAWSGPLPKVLQQFIAQSASAVPGVMGAMPESGVPADAKLFVRVNDFEPVYETGEKFAPLLKASLTFTLMNQRETIRASFTLAKKQMAASNSLTAIATGLEALAREMTLEALCKMKLAPCQPHQTPD